MDYFVEPRAEGELRIDACETETETLAVLEISVLSEGGETAFERVICDGQGRGVVMGLPDDLARIRLQVRPGEGGGAPNRVAIRKPRILSSAPPLAVSRPFSTEGPSDRRPNVVVYLVDALRADRLGTYGCERPLSPRLDAIAAEGITFTDMTAQSSWTKAAVASIFTGLWPRVHGVQHIDLLPTILERSGVESWGELPGEPLLNCGADNESASDRVVLAYLDYWDRRGAAVIRDGWKLIEPLSINFGSSAELFRHDIDPGESRELLAASPLRAGWLGARLSAELRRRGESQTTQVAPEIREQLEALGYMH